MDSLLAFSIDRSLNFTFALSGVIVACLGVILVALVAWKLYSHGSFFKSFEINEAEFGLGEQKIRISPNIVDKQIAYKIWVELSTRKIGLPIDLDDDVLSEIYDSWFSFFSVTRELIKEVPAQKFKRPDTEAIIRLSIEVLNIGIRPHLTKWQARFRRWYDKQLTDQKYLDNHPQDIQKLFPQFNELQEDLQLVNSRLISYRLKMYELIKKS